MKVLCLLFATAGFTNGQRYTRFHNGAQGDCLTLKGEGLAIEQELSMEKCDGSSAQEWLYGSVINPEGTIRPQADTTLCVTVQNSTSGGLPYLTDCEAGMNQEFFFTDTNQLELGTSGVSLTSNTDGSVSVTPNDANDNAKKWSLTRIVPIEEDFFVLKNVISDNCVGFSRDPLPGTKVVASVCDGSTQQMWTYIPITRSIIPYSSRDKLDLCLAPYGPNYSMGSELQPCSGYVIDRQWNLDIGAFILNDALPRHALTEVDNGELPLVEIATVARQQWFRDPPGFVERVLVSKSP